MNIMEIMKQAKNMQKKMEEAQSKVGELEAEGVSGGGMVRIAISGNKEMKKIYIDASLLDASEKEVLEDLIVAAFNDAKLKIDAIVSKEMEAVTAGLPLPPGVKLPF